GPVPGDHPGPMDRRSDLLAARRPAASSATAAVDSVAGVGAGDGWYDEFEMSLAASLLQGDVRALAKAISLAEDRDPEATQIVTALQTHTGRATLLGITGPPGSGKSSWVDLLLQVIRQRGK